MSFRKSFRNCGVLWVVRFAGQTHKMISPAQASDAITPMEQRSGAGDRYAQIVNKHGAVRRCLRMAMMAHWLLDPLST